MRMDQTLTQLGKATHYSRQCNMLKAHPFFSRIWRCLPHLFKNVKECNQCLRTCKVPFRSSEKLPKMRGSSVILKLVKKMILRIFKSPTKLDYTRLTADDETGSLTDYLPEDVKEGQFVVHTVNDNGEVKRFVIEMSYLAHPGFLKLLEHAAEEFGFEQEGVLAVPCRPSELGRILESKKEKRA